MLTGRTRYRTSWLGKQILQVQYEQDGYGHWRDASRYDHGELAGLQAHREVGVPYIPQPGYNPRTGQMDSYREAGSWMVPKKVGHIPPRPVPRPRAVD